MNKAQFLTELNHQLKEIPEKERTELIEDYVSHFEFGSQEGKTEEEIVKELGTPAELAADAIDEYKRTQPIKLEGITNPNSPKTERTVFSIMGLVFINFVCAVLPLLLSIWATWACLLLAFVIATVSPLAALVDFVVNQYFSAGKLFLSFVMAGVSIFLVFGTLYIGKYLAKISASYFKWNMKIIKGAE